LISLAALCPLERANLASCGLSPPINCLSQFLITHRYVKREKRQSKEYGNWVVHNTTFDVTVWHVRVNGRGRGCDTDREMAWCSCDSIALMLQQRAKAR